MYLFNQNWHGESVPTMAHLCAIFGTFVYPAAYRSNLCTLSTKNGTFCCESKMAESCFVPFSAKFLLCQKWLIAALCHIHTSKN